MKKAYILPMIVAVAVAGIVLLRPRSPGDTAQPEDSSRSVAVPPRPVAGGRPGRPPGTNANDPAGIGRPAPPAALPPASLPSAELPSTAKAFRRAVEDLIPRLRPILEDLLGKHPFTGTKEEMDAIKQRLKTALLETGDPAALAAIVLWSAGAGGRMEALAQVRGIALEVVRQDKELGTWLRSRSVSHFLAESAADGEQALSERLFALDFLSLQTEDLAGLTPGSISPLMYCLSPEDLHLLRTGLGKSLQKEEPIVYFPLLKLLGTYLSVSPEAREAMLDLLQPPPQNQTLRLNLMNAIASQNSHVLEDPTAFRFLIASLKDTADPKLSTTAALAFVRSPTLVGGTSPQAGEALSTLLEQYRWARSAGDDRAIKTQEQTFLISIASTDVPGTPAFVRDALLDSTVTNGAKLTMLKRIQNIASGAIDVDHGYRKTAPALSEAIQSVSAQLSTIPLFKDALQAALDSLAANQKR